jgi:hypothetical protein
MFVALPSHTSGGLSAFYGRRPCSRSTLTRHSQSLSCRIIASVPGQRYLYWLLAETSIRAGELSGRERASAKDSERRQEDCHLPSARRTALEADWAAKGSRSVFGVAPSRKTFQTSSMTRTARLWTSRVVPPPHPARLYRMSGRTEFLLEKLE